MLPDPLHPAIVHLPIALAVIIPFFAIVSIWLIGRGFLPARTWVLVILLQALLVGSGWAALESGENEEERVERVVEEHAIEEHEESAERFLLLAGIGLLLTGGGLRSDKLGAAGRVVATVATFAVLAAGIAVGHSGGELVYEHGAANAYLDTPQRLISSVVGEDPDDEDD
jgi:hypothetical protein